MASTRPHTKHSYANQNDIQLFAFGQPLLYIAGEGNAYMRRANDYSNQFRKKQEAQYGKRRGLFAAEFTPVYVDGVPQITDETWRLQSDEIRFSLEPAYGKHHSAVAYREPLKRRFHTSADFDYCEGLYDGPFISAEPKKLLYGVSHQRQVLFVRKLGLWIVTDRMRAPEAHTYKVDWKFAQAFQVAGKKVPGFTLDQIVSSAGEKSLKTKNPETANLSIYEFSQAALKMTASGAEVAGAGEQTVVSVLYPRKTIKDELRAIRATGDNGFETTLPDGSRVLYQAEAADRKIQLEDISATGECLLLTIHPDGKRHGVALGVTGISIAGVRQTIDGADFEFELAGPRIQKVTPIHKPMDLVRIVPEADRFVGELEVSLTHNEPGSVMRFTLDGAEPDHNSRVYSTPFRIRSSAVVKARAFRKGVSVTSPSPSLDSIPSNSIQSHYSPRRAVVSRCELRLVHALGDSQCSRDRPFVGDEKECGLVHRGECRSDPGQGEILRPGSPFQPFAI